jgi:hypothetical protein
MKIIVLRGQDLTRMPSRYIDGEVRNRLRCIFFKEMGFERMANIINIIGEARPSDILIGMWPLLVWTFYTVS